LLANLWVVCLNSSPALQDPLAHYTQGVCITSSILKFFPHVDVSHCKSKETEIPQGAADRSDSKIEIDKRFARTPPTTQGDEFLQFVY